MVTIATCLVEQRLGTECRRSLGHSQTRCGKNKNEKRVRIAESGGEVTSTASALPDDVIGGNSGAKRNVVCAIACKSNQSAIRKDLNE